MSNEFRGKVGNTERKVVGRILGEDFGHENLLGNKLAFTYGCLCTYCQESPLDSA